MLLVISVLQVGLVMIGPAIVRRENPPTALRNQVYRNDQLRREQKALNLCRDAITRLEALPTEKARQRLEQFKQLENYSLNRIKALGGEPDSSVGKLTIQDLPNPQILQEDIQRSLLEAARKTLATNRATIKKVEAREGDEDRTLKLNMLRELEAVHLRQVEQLESGSIQPVMPIVPRAVMRDTDKRQ